VETGEKCNSPIIQLLDPFGRVVVPILHWDWDVDAVIVFLVSLRWVFTVPPCFHQFRCQFLNPGLELLMVLCK
jgi:hypothetical protein